MVNTRVIKKQIDELLNASEVQEHIFHGKELNVSYKLPCGFTVTGRGACVDPVNFDLEIGRRVAREDAENQLWQLEGYLLQNALFGRSVLSEELLATIR